MCGPTEHPELPFSPFSLDHLEQTERCPLDNMDTLPRPHFGGSLGPLPLLWFRVRLTSGSEGERGSAPRMCLLSCHTNQTVVSVRCLCIAAGQVASAVLMTQRVWGSEDKGALEPPQSARLMLPFQPARSAAECARLRGKWSVPGPGGPGPIKTQARLSSPTLIILDLSHISTVCKYHHAASGLESAWRGGASTDDWIDGS